MKKALAVLAVILVIGVGYGLYLFNKKTPSLEHSAPDYTLTADALFTDFEQDEPGSIAKYEGKVLQVTGTVIMVSQTDSISNLILKAEDALFGGINCSFMQLDQAVQTDDTVTVKGQCQGYLTNVILNNCVLTK